MLVELREVEVFVEPNDILTQALQEGDLSVDKVIQECISEEGVEAVLDAVDNADISNYCNQHNIDVEVDTYAQIFEVVNNFTKQEKAMLLWQLLKCKEV